MSETEPKAGWRLKFAGAALIFAILAVAWFAVAALGTKFGLWGWQFGLGKMTIGWGPMIIFAAVGFGVLALIIALIKAPRKQPTMLALAALLICSMVFFRIMGFGAQATGLPPLHDIQTDWSEPVRFSEAMLMHRKDDGAMNPVEDEPVIPDAANARWPGMGGRLVSVVQEEAEVEQTVDGQKYAPVYPVIEPMYFDQSPTEVADAVTELARSRGWDISTLPDLGEGDTETTLEATETSGWFGFKDDVAIRIRGVDGVTRVDMRSISRVGLSDLGANAKRVSSFMYELEDRADGRPAP